MDRLYRTVAQYAKYAFRKRPDDDWADRLSYVYTCVTFVVFSILIGTRQYVGESIICWTPAQFTTIHVRYANNICWIKNTYYLPPSDDIPNDIQSRSKKEIGYYQWIPLVLFVQAFSFYIPHLMWRGFMDREGVNLKAIVHTTLDVHNLNPDIRLKTVRFVAKHIEQCLESQREYRTGWLVRLRHFLSRVCCLFIGSRYGNKLCCVYLTIKSWYLINSVGNLVFLNVFLETNYTFYGIQLLMDLRAGRDWESSGIFPRVTMCDFEIRVLGNVHRHTVQCVLPSNLFNEKLFLMVWFWLLFASILTTYNLYQWIASVVLQRGRIQFTKKYLKLCQSASRLNGCRVTDQELQSKVFERFVLLYLRIDGIFVMKMIAKNAGQLVVSDIFEYLWTSYRVRYTKKSYGNVLEMESSVLSGAGNKLPGAGPVSAASLPKAGAPNDPATNTSLRGTLSMSISNSRHEDVF